MDPTIDCKRCATIRRPEPVRAHNPLGVALVLAGFGLAWAVVGGVVLAMIVGVL